MTTNDRRQGKMARNNPLVELDETVSFASTTPRVIRTKQAGRLIGFGCSGAEESAHQSLENFLMEHRENPGDPGEFESKLREHLSDLETQILSAQRERAAGT